MRRTIKKLVICCDGTWNPADQAADGGEPSPTNALLFADLTTKFDPAGRPQVRFYDQGVGTGNCLDRLYGGSFGRGLEDNIHNAYRFVVENWEPGDEIFLLGFSRGAYIARSICGMIRKCGILKRESLLSVRLYRKALALYRRRDTVDSAASRNFRSRYSVVGDDTIPIHFVGVWETVGALGIPLRGLRSLTRREYHRFHDTYLSGSIKHAYHALAIDERRAIFEPTLWTNDPRAGQTVEQVWFAGVHSEVGGGGYGQRRTSNISLVWMLGKAQEAGLGLNGVVLRAMQDESKRLAPLSNEGPRGLGSGIDRVIGAKPDSADADSEPVDDFTQSLHPSVRQRWAEDSSYRPPNLAAYLRGTGNADG